MNPPKISLNVTMLLIHNITHCVIIVVMVGLFVREQIPLATSVLSSSIISSTSLQGILANILRIIQTIQYGVFGVMA